MCKSRAKFYHVSSWYQTPYYSRWSGPNSNFWLGIEWLPTRLKLWYHRLLFSMHSLKYYSYGTSCTTFWIRRRMHILRRDTFLQSFPPGRVRRTMEIPKKGWRLDHDDLKQRNEDINERDQLLRKGQPRPRRLVSFSLPALPPLTPPLKSRDEISCSGGELWRPDN